MGRIAYDDAPWMTHEEICRDYRGSLRTPKKIKILAEINNVPKNLIERILADGGETLPAHRKKKKGE